MRHLLLLSPPRLPPLQAAALLRVWRQGASVRQLCSQQQQQQQQRQAEADAKRRRYLGFASGALCLTLFGGFYVWKEAKLQELEARVMQGRVGPESSVGSAVGVDKSLSVGGDFRLQDQDGKFVTRQDLTAASASGWLLIYFGFCHCPDICPEQMEKMAEVVERLRLAKQPLGVTPVFLSIDPERDTPALVKEYIADFGGRFIGLTGPKPDVEAVAKKYRVYYSKGPVDQDGDYIVDHAIIMYLVSPDGRVVDYYGQTKTAREVAACIAKVIHGYSGGP